MHTQVKSRAAHDFSCGVEQTQIVDAEGGVYRLEGCGFQASYHCTEDSGLKMQCQRLYMSEIAEPVDKPENGSSLAKSQ